MNMAAIMSMKSLLFVLFLALTALEASSRSNLSPSRGRPVSAHSTTEDATEIQRPTPSPIPSPKEQPAPRDLTAIAISSNQINLTWTSYSENAPGFYVERALSEKGPWKRVASLPANATSCANGGLEAHTIYYYRVMAHNSAFSNIASATTRSRLPAGAPTRLEAFTKGSTEITLSWTNNAGDATNLQIERCQNPGCSNFTKIANVGADVTSFTDTGLSPSASYSYRVQAYNNAMRSEYSNTATVNTMRNTNPPLVPTGVIATAVGSFRINLVWTPSTANGSEVAGYNVYQAGTRIGSTLEAKYSVQGLEAKTQYCYTITAFDRSGNASGNSDPACATTKSPDDP